MNERLSWPGWLTYSGRITHISGHLSATGSAKDRESSPARDRRSTAVSRSQLFSLTTYILHVCGTFIASFHSREWLNIYRKCFNCYCVQCLTATTSTETILLSTPPLSWTTYSVIISAHHIVSVNSSINTQPVITHEVSGEN